MKLWRERNQDMLRIWPTGNQVFIKNMLFGVRSWVSLNTVIRSFNSSRKWDIEQYYIGKTT